MKKKKEEEKKKNKKVNKALIAPYIYDALCLVSKVRGILFTTGMQ